MNWRTILYALRYPSISGKFIPFVVSIPARIKIRTNNLVLHGRLFIGAPGRNKQRVSATKVNIDFADNSVVQIGHSVSVGPGVHIVVKQNAELKIGDGTYFTSDLHLECCKQISIGNNCAISWGSTIIDSDHHELDYEGKISAEEKVIIGDNVWIGCNVTLLKGTEIGSGSVVAAGSVVKGIFPAHVLIAGNPARVIKQDVKWK